MNRRARSTVPRAFAALRWSLTFSRTDGRKIVGIKLQSACRRARAGDKPARIAFPSCSG